MKLSIVAAALLGLLAFAAGYGFRWVTSRDPGAVARVELLQHRADSLAVVAAHRDTVNVTRLVAVRARTDAALNKPSIPGQPGPLMIEVDTVKVLVAAERAACDTALAAKDSTIAETNTLRNDAITEARHLARRGPSRLAVATLVLISQRDRPRLAESLSYRVTRVLGLDVNMGVALRW